MIGTHPNRPSLNPELVRVGATIREMRQMCGLTQEDLARAALISRPYLANIESGRSKPSRRAVARIAAALHVPQISIIAGPDDTAGCAA